MDIGSARRGKSSPVAGDSVDSGSPIAIEAVKPESSATASPLASATTANLNGTAAAGASGASEPMETTETDEVETVSKKRKTGTGSRGVANLTPEQLAKKRANGKCLLRLSPLQPSPLPITECFFSHHHFWNYCTFICTYLIRWLVHLPACFIRLYISLHAVLLVTNGFDLFLSLYRP